MNLEYTSDSDVSDDTRDLVQQGLATVKRKRVMVALQTERLRDRPLVPNMDISHIRRPLGPDSLNGATLTYGLNPVKRESSNGQNYNICMYSRYVCVCAFTFSSCNDIDHYMMLFFVLFLLIALSVVRAI